MYYFCSIQKKDTGNKVRITILQTDIIWEKPEENRGKVLRMITGSPHSDLYVLPEMWTTGFTVNPSEASRHETLSLEWMKRIAAECKCAICGSLVFPVGDGYRNRLCFVYPDGTLKHYDKRHLFPMAGEDRFYTRGNERVIVKYLGVRFLLLVCYDLRFPVWQRNNGDYDAIIIVANWPESRQNVWNILLRARAIENQCYVIGANRTGSDPGCLYMGNSAIIDARGNAVRQADGKEQSVTAEIDMEGLERFRTKFPVLKDRDIFSIY